MYQVSENSPMAEKIAGSDGQSASEVAALFQRLALDLGQIQDTNLALDVILRQGQKLLEASSAAAFVIGEDGYPVHHILIDLPTKAVDLLANALEILFTDAPHELLSGAVMIEDLAAEDCPDLVNLGELGVDSCLVLPLAQRGDLLGALWFLFKKRHHLTKLRLNWAVVLASHASLTLENARLVDLALRQATELGAFYETAATVESKHDQSDLLNQILNQMTTLLDCQMGVIFLADEERHMLTPVVHRGIRNGFQVMECPYGEGVAGRVAETREPLVVDECNNWEGMAESLEGSSSSVRVLGMPMIWHQRLIGVLDLAANITRRSFSAKDVRLAKSVAYQAANALGIASLIESERRQFRMAEALQEASLVFSHQVELDEVLDRILEQVMHAFPCDAANIQRVEGNRIQIIRHRGYERFDLSTGSINEFSVEIEDDINLQRLMAGEVVVIPDTTQEPSWNFHPGWEWVRSWAGSPIQYGQEILGFINLDSSTSGTFDDATIQSLAAFAAHASAAMHKAELYRRLAGEHRRLRTLYEIERAVTVSLEPDEILTHLLEGALDAVHGVFGQIFMVADDKKDTLKRGPRVDRLGDDDLAVHPQARQLVEQSINQVTPVHATLIYPSRSYSVLAFPIATGKHVWGGVLVWMADDEESIEAWLEVFRAAGQQVGLALTNADQHAQVQRRLAEMTLLQRVVRAIAGRLEVESMLREVTEQLHTNLGFPAVQIYRRVGDELVLVEASGPQPILERMQIQRGIMGRVARTGQPALVEDVHKDPDYVAGLVGTQAELAVPIRLDEEIIGVLNIETSDPSHVDNGALELLMLLADQVSVALQNATLYERVQDNVVHLEEQIKIRTLELEQALEKAQEADHAKAQFVGDISHELRTPLTNIGLYLDLVEMGDEDRFIEYMTTLRRETERLGSLIEQLLAISHLDTGQVELKPEPTDVNSLIQVLVLDRARMIGEKNLDLNVVTRKDLPLAYVDPQHIIQAMTNLLTNAMNYTPSGGKINIETKQRTWKGRQWVTVAVGDTGPGITGEEKKRVFDRFYRGLVGKTSGIPGTGLGLPISKEIVERHGGRIELVSKSGEGTCFTLWLPVAEQTDPDHR